MKGILGPSVLCIHPQYDVVRGTVIDDLHCIYIGVTKKLLHLWFDDSERGKPYHIGRNVSFLCSTAWSEVKNLSIAVRKPCVTATCWASKSLTWFRGSQRDKWFSTLERWVQQFWQVSRRGECWCVIIQLLHPRASTIHDSSACTTSFFSWAYHLQITVHVPFRSHWFDHRGVD